MEKYQHGKITGHIQDYAIYKDGSKELIHESYNLIVNTIGVLISALMKQDSTHKNNTMYWAVGTGTTAVTELDTALETEVYRKAIEAANMSYISGGNPTGTPTNILRITLIFTESEANANLTEFGIFGGNATSSAGSGIMINHKVHAVIAKTASYQLQRVITFTF